MVTRRTIFIGAALLLGGARTLPGRSVLAANASALSFVAPIYEAYKGKNAKGISLDGEAAIRRYFEPSLAALIIKDRKSAERRKEVPALDGDPFVDAQDWEIADVSIEIADKAPDKASATVSFRNAGTPSTVVLDLVTVKNDWRIADIVWQHDGKPETLRGLFGR